MSSRTSSPQPSSCTNSSTSGDLNKYIWRRNNYASPSSAYLLGLIVSSDIRRYNYTYRTHADIRRDLQLLECFKEVESQRRYELLERDFALNQAFEINIHLGDNIRRSKEFPAQTARLFAKYGFTDDKEFEGEYVVDVGAGSRMRGIIFKGAKLVAIEPMSAILLNYISKSEKNAQEQSHMDFFKPSVVHQLYAQAAEQRVCELEGKVAFVFCINALDHSYAPDLSRTAFLKMGEKLLSVDLEHAPRLGHPWHLTQSTIEKEIRRNNLRIINFWEENRAFAKNASSKLGTWLLQRICA